MNKQRKVVITTTYNEMGIIIDTKAEEVAQPYLQPTCNRLATDTISRQAAIDALDCISGVEEVLRSLPSAQPERLTDDDFETIRIHLSAIKEKLCNQHRWDEAEDYQRLLDRFMAFASAQPDIKEMAVDIGYLRDWYQSSVLNDEWPDRYIEEVHHDFYLIPKTWGERDE